MVAAPPYWRSGAIETAYNNRVPGRDAIRRSSVSTSSELPA